MGFLRDGVKAVLSGLASGCPDVDRPELDLLGMLWLAVLLGGAARLFLIVSGLGGG